MADLAVLDFDAFARAFDTERRTRWLSWSEFADELWEQSHELIRATARRPVLVRRSQLPTRERGAISCRYALFILRWLDRAPEEFLAGPSPMSVAPGCPRPGPTTDFAPTSASCMTPSTIGDKNSA